MLPGIPIGDIAPPTLVGIFFLLVFFGRLVPWWFYKSKADEAEKWRAAFEVEREARIASVAQTEKLIDSTKELHGAVMAVLHGAELTRQTGEAYVVPTSKK
jgi:hypothetical protein